MAVDERGRATVRLKEGDKTVGKFVCFNTRAVRLLEKELGINFFTFFAGDEKALQEKISVTTATALLWAGLRGAGLKWSIDEVADRMILRDILEYVTPIFEAIKWAMGGDDSPAEADAKDAEDDPLRPTEAPEEAP